MEEGKLYKNQKTFILVWAKGNFRQDVFKPSGEHFNLPGQKLNDIDGMVLEQVRSENLYILRAREELLIKNLDSYKFGLNKEP